MISVIIPCYNSEKWVKEALLSAVNQTYLDIEIIVIDDGSTDNTNNIINSINDDRIKYFYKRNGGLSSARNYGIEKSEGEWVAFLDSDDIWELDKLKKYINESLNYDVVYSDFNIVNSENIIQKSNHNIHPKHYNYNYKREILKGNRISGGSSIMLKKKVLNFVGEFNIDLKVAEDWEYWGRVIWAGYRLKFINEKLTRVRHHGTSLQKTTDNQQWNICTEKILKYFIAFENISNNEKAIIYKKLTTLSYRFNNNFRKYIGFYINAIILNRWMLIDSRLLWLTFKFPIRFLIKRLDD